MRLARAVLVGAAVLALASCSDGNDDAVTATTAAASDTTSAAEANPAEVLEAVALRLDDLPTGASLEPIPGGDQVTNQVTMDMCGAEFPSEELRVARLQQIAADPAGETIVNNETVLYESADAATQAFAELRSAIADCDPNVAVGSSVSGIPDAHYLISELPETEVGTLTDDHVAINVTLRLTDGRSRDFTLLYQRRGAIVVGIYGSSPGAVLPYAEIVATRIGQLSAAQAGG